MGNSTAVIIENTPGGVQKTLHSHRRMYAQINTKKKTFSGRRKLVGFPRGETDKESPRQAGSKPVDPNDDSAGKSVMKQ